MLIYAIQTSARLQYIIEFISNELLLDDLHITTDQYEYCSYNGPKINYSPARVSGEEIWICNSGLLFETGIEVQNIYCIDINRYKVFFQTDNGDWPFDLFAATFYLLSRYEEYLPHEKDIYGRFAHANSLAYKESFIHLPLINIWVNDFKNALLQKFAGIGISNKSFTYLPTYDIDIAWSYLNKGWLRNTGGFLRSVIKQDWYAAKERIQVILKKKLDPFDSYEWLHNIHTHCNVKATYFFLMAARQKGFDKNISPSNNHLKNLIRIHASLYSTGIHPSWQSGDNYKLLLSEIRELEDIVGHKIVYSRQHYLRTTLPVTYQQLINAGIQKDYSMGYATINGFRASVASSFYWYDLSKETSTNLLVYPFCFMDATAYYQLGLSPEQVLHQLYYYHQIIKEVNGLMITIWHNNFLGTDPAFAGWFNVYEKFLKDTIAIKI